MRGVQSGLGPAASAAGRAVLCGLAVAHPTDPAFDPTATEDLALEQALPGVTRGLGRFPLTCLPTAVHALPRLGAEAGLDSLWIKRDDRTSPLYGGNKPRKLEWLLGDAVRRGRRSVMTFGGLGTNHGLATTICARRAGLSTTLILVPQPVTDGVRRGLLLDHAFGAELVFARGVVGAAAVALVRLARGVLGGGMPALIPAGGSSPRGAIGYVNAGFELARQVRSGQLPEPDWVFVPLGTGGTAAGLALGLRMAGLGSRVAAVLVTDILSPSAARLARLERRTLALLGGPARDLCPAGVPGSNLVILRDFVGAGYGSVTDEGLRARALAADLEGLGLETTYGAKCLAALLRVAREPGYRGRTVLFWNTYSSVDLAGRVRLPEPRELPPAFRRFFPEA